MTGPPCGELSRYLDELRAQRAAEAKAAETAVIPDNCMAMGVNLSGIPDSAEWQPGDIVVLMPAIKPCSKCKWEWEKLDNGEQCPYCCYLREDN